MNQQTVLLLLQHLLAHVACGRSNLDRCEKKNAETTSIVKHLTCNINITIHKHHPKWWGSNLRDFLVTPPHKLPRLSDTWLEFKNNTHKKRPYQNNDQKYCTLHVFPATHIHSISPHQAVSLSKGKRSLLSQTNKPWPLSMLVQKTGVQTQWYPVRGDLTVDKSEKGFPFITQVFERGQKLRKPIRFTILFPSMVHGSKGNKSQGSIAHSIKHVSIPLFDRSWLLDVQLWWTTWEFKDIRSTWQSAWLLPAKLTVAYTKSVPLKRWWHKVYILKWSSLCPTLHYVKLNPCCAKEVIIFLAKHWLIHHFTSLKRQNMLAQKVAPKRLAESDETPIGHAAT